MIFRDDLVAIFGERKFKTAEEKIAEAEEKKKALQTEATDDENEAAATTLNPNGSITVKS